ncbi:MAG TPA: glutamate--tRNA ligase family protein, partial [Acidobacteriota bacterium]|nr:glutamate--tRNA ligase family protein [Acidobacteriota bacterium]
VEEYRNQGILPEALDNFLALLGWNPGDEREILSLQELSREFDFDRVNSSNAVFDLKKLQWMNGKYLSSIELSRVIELVKPYLENQDWVKDPGFAKLIDLMRTRALTLVELAQMVVPFYNEDFPYDQAAFEKYKKDPSVAGLLAEYAANLEKLTPWNHASLEGSVRDLTTKKGIKAAVLIHPIRLALTGRTGGPSLFELMELMGKQNCLVRLHRFIASLSS